MNVAADEWNDKYETLKDPQNTLADEELMLIKYC